MLFKTVIFHCHNGVQINLRDFSQGSIIGISLNLCDLLNKRLFSKCIMIHFITQSAQNTASNEHSEYRQSEKTNYEFSYSFHVLHLPSR